MLTLSTSDFIAGVASAASKLTTTVVGMELTGTTETYKVLYQGQLPIAAASLYDPPDDTVAFVRSILIVNTDTLTRTFSLFVNGLTDANRIIGPITLPAGYSATWAADGWGVYSDQGQRLGVGATGAAGDPGGSVDYAEAADLSIQAFGDVQTAGVSTEVPRADHKHGFPTVTASAVSIADAFGRFAAANVEDVLYELQYAYAGPGIIYDFSSTTTAGDPTTGRFRLNNATLASATELYLHETDLAGLSRAAQLAAWDDSTATVKGYLYLNDIGSAAKWAWFAVGARTDNGTWNTFALTHIASGTIFESGDDVRLFFARTTDAAGGGAVDYAETADISTQAFGDSPAAGASVTEVAGANHVHGMPANPVTAHEAASDPHTGYVLESLVNAKGDLIAATADNVVTRLGVGANGTVLTADSAQATGIAWAAAGGGGAPSGAAGGDLGGTYPNPTVNDDGHAHSSTTVTTHSTAHAHSSLTGLTSGDDHTQYQKESEKGAASGYASLDSGILVPVAQLGSGTPTGLKFLRDDRTWQVPAGGGGLTDHTHAATGAGADGGGTSLSPLTLILPGVVNPTVTAEGSVKWDTTSSFIAVGNGASTSRFYPVDDGATPVAQAFGDAAATGDDLATARRDHVHGMPADPTAGLVSTINFVIDGGGAVIATGIKGDLVVDFACTITKWTVLADVSGSIAVAIWKDSYANYPPVVGDLLVTPTISAANKAQTGSLSHALAAGDVLRYNVNSAATITRATVALTVTRT